MKSSEVSFKTRSTKASLTIRGQVTKGTVTVKWSIVFMYEQWSYAIVSFFSRYYAPTKLNSVTPFTRYCQSSMTWASRSAYHLNGIFGKNGTGRSAPQKTEKKWVVPFVNPFTNTEKVWVQTNMAANISLILYSFNIMNRRYQRLSLSKVSPFKSKQFKSTQHKPLGAE